jgi:hypothetical protein
MLNKKDYRITRLGLFISGFLEVVDGLTTMICSVFRKSGTSFAFRFSAYDSMRRVRKLIEKQ